MVVKHQLLGICGDEQVLSINNTHNCRQLMRLRSQRPLDWKYTPRKNRKLTYCLPRHDVVLNLYNNNGYSLTATEFGGQEYKASDSVAVQEICDILKHIEEKLGDEKLGEHLKSMSGCIGFQMNGYLFILAHFKTSLDQILNLDRAFSMKGELIVLSS